MIFENSFAQHKSLFSFFLLSFFFVGFVGCHSKAKKEYDLLQEEVMSINQQLMSAEYHIRNLTDKFKLEKNLDETKFNKNLKLVNSAQEEISLGDVVQNSTKLVFKYSFLNCSTCVNAQLDGLDKVIADIGVENVLILATLEKARDLVIFEKNRKTPYSIFRMVEDNKDNVIFDSEHPCFFILENGVVKYTFVPLVEFPGLTSYYLDFAKKMFQ